MWLHVVGGSISRQAGTRLKRGGEGRTDRIKTENIFQRFQRFLDLDLKPEKILKTSIFLLYLSLEVYVVYLLYPLKRAITVFQC